VSVSGRGVDLHLFRPGRPGIDSARERWAPGDVRVLCVSRVAPEKNLKRLVALAAANPQLSVLLVGAGPQLDELRRIAPPNVRLSGLLEGDDLGDVYSAADVFAFPSPTETFGQVVQEAMASGLPVVGVDAGGVADLVLDGRTGILAEPGGDAWERGVLTLAGDPAARASLGAAGREAVEPRSWDAVLDSLFLDYARLRPDRGGRPTAGASRPPQGDAAAFMDVDRTVVRGSSVLALAGPLARAGILSKRLLVRAAISQIRFAARGADEAGLLRVAQKGGAALAGARVADLRSAGGDAVRTHIAPLVYPGARQLIADHHARGEKVFLVSSAPEEIVQEIVRLVGADGCVATRAEVVDGVFTGRLLRLVQGREKVRAIHELADRHRLDLRRCVAYGDSVSDAPMLAAVGRGVCVNPDSRLAGMARLRGWEVRRFRTEVRELGHPERLAALA
ncbi:MAG TPA: HAD-IB family hydrolase, partial [Candidatus Dormibacteraeota bacterium]|nr:HAD-IB family hydrolase [Candidatus Dormibacteraeota bacterium]